MVTFNLLPWRQYQKAQQQKRLTIIMGSVILFSVTTIMIAYLVMSAWERQRAYHITALTSEWHRYQESNALRRKKFLSQTKPVNQVNHDITMDKLFSGLAKQSPENVCFTEMVRDKNTIIFTGVTDSAADLTTYLRQWSLAYLFTDITLKLLEQQDNGSLRFIFLARENHEAPRHQESSW